MKARTQHSDSTNERMLFVCEAAFAILTLLMALTVRDLPMVDLPQHVAQLATWLRLGRPEVAHEYQLNFRTPYL